MVAFTHPRQKQPSASRKETEMAKPVMSGIWKGEVRGFKYGLDVVQLGSHVSGLLHVGGFEKTGNISSL